MKTKYIAIASMAVAFFATSCSETYDIYPDEYSAVVRFKDGGEQQITVYSPQATVEYPITIQKGGTDPSKNATAKVRLMTQEEFDNYLSESGAGYVFLPTDCYSFSESAGSNEANVTFDGDGSYKILNLNIFPPKIGDFLDSYTDTRRTPVIPLILESESTIDEYSYELFVAPEYKEPHVGILNGTGGESMYVLREGESEVELKVGLPFTSEWEITGSVTADTDEEVLKSINDSYSTSYSMMPADAYTTSGSFKINPGEDFATVKVKVDVNKADFRTMLPLTVNLTSDGFAVEETPFAIVVENADPYKLNITADMLTCNDVYSGDGAGIPGLVDGDPTTHCHSWYGSNARNFDDFGSYIWIQDLGKSYRRFAIDIYNRSSYNNGHVKRFKLWAKNASGSYEEFADCRTEDWLTDRGSLGCFGSFEAPFETDSIIISIIEADGGSLVGQTTAFWSIGEIVLYGK